MKERNTSKNNNIAKSWLGLLTYRIAQDSAKTEEFAAKLKNKVSNNIQGYDFDALRKVTVNMDPAELKIRLMRGLRSSKSRKRMGDYLEAYRSYQGVQTSSGDTNSVRTLGDCIPAWAKITDQDPAQFMQRVAPKLNDLVATWREESGCSGLTDSETLAHPQEASKFLRGMNAMLVQETPADKLQGLAHQIIQCIQRLEPQEFISSLDAPLTQASTMMTAYTTRSIQEALASNPTVKEDILQPEFGALAELGSRNCGLQDNYQQAVEQLREKLGQELAAQGVEASNDLMDKVVAKLDKNDILGNLRDAISGNLHKRYIVTAIGLWNTVYQRVKSVWQFQTSESPATKDNILDFLFRRKTND